MRYKFLFCFSCGILIYNLLCSQTKLTKDEIFAAWITLYGQGDTATVKNLITYDSILNKKLYKNIMLLEQSNVDTIGVFVKSNPGGLIYDSCIRGLYPTNIYLFWTISGKKFIKKISNNCEWPAVNVNTLEFFTYYHTNKEHIKGEFIMPTILGAEKNKDGKFKFTREIIDHDSRYLLFYQDPLNSRLLEFSNSDITNKQNLFYNDNIQTSSYQWFLATANQIRLEFHLK